MAVPVRVFLKILLMALLGGKEVPERLHRDGQRRARFPLFAVKYRMNRGKLALVVVINPGSVLDAAVVALPVDGERVDDHKVIVQQFFKRQRVFVIGNPHRFRVSAVRADILIGRRRVRSIGVTDRRFRYAVKLVKKFLKSPETASRKINCPHIAPPR